jgi:hypothetical protein
MSPMLTEEGPNPSGEVYFGGEGGGGGACGGGVEEDGGGVAVSGSPQLHLVNRRR